MGPSSVLAQRRGPATSAPACYTFEAYAGRTGLSALRDDWTQITAAAGHVRFFQLYEWHSSYLERLMALPVQVHFFLARQEGVPVGIVPLLRTRRLVAGVPVRSFEFPTHAHLPLADCVVRRPKEALPVLAGLVAELRQHRYGRWDVLFLPNLLEDAHAAAALHDRRCGPAVRVLVGRRDYLRCEPFERLSSRFSKNFRANLRKARYKLEALGGGEYQTAHEPAELRRALVEFLDVEASGWKGIRGTGSAIQLDPQVLAFYQELVESFGALGACEINLLRTHGGHCIAGQLCLLVGDTCSVLKTGYDEAYAHVAPGHMLKEYLIRRHSAAGAIRYIDLVTDAPWHTDWRPFSAAVMNVYLFNGTTAGRLGFVTRNLKSRLGRWYRALRGTGAAPQRAANGL